MPGAATTAHPPPSPASAPAAASMRAAVLVAPGRIEVRRVPRPRAGHGDAVVRTTLAAVSDADVRMLRGECPAPPGLVVGRGLVGVVEELGPGVTGHEVGDRVVVGAVARCGRCGRCDGAGVGVGRRPGGTIGGAHAEHVRVPTALASLATIPPELTDEQVLPLADVAAAGIAGVEAGGVRPGDAVVVGGQGPVGLCATVGARLVGAAIVVAVDGDDARLAMARRLGADVALDHRACDVAAEVRRLTGGGADVAVETLGAPDALERCLRALRPGGTLSLAGPRSGATPAADALAAGPDARVVTAPCPGCGDRLRRLVGLVLRGRMDLTPLLTHQFVLDDAAEAYDLVASGCEGVLQVVIATGAGTGPRGGDGTP